MRLYTNIYIELYIMSSELKMKSRGEETYQKIRDAITYGKLNPGERLVEHQVCANFQVGRTPLREALRRLQTEGYVDFFPHKGVTISKLSIDDVEQIYDIIAMLEGYATEVATHRLTKEDMQALISLHHKMIELNAQQNFRPWLEHNALFHAHIVKASENQHLSKLITGLRDRLYRYRFLSVTILGQSGKYSGDHEKILAALRSKKAQQAGKLMRDHVSYVAELMIGLLRQSPGL